MIIQDQNNPLSASIYDYQKNEYFIEYEQKLKEKKLKKQQKPSN